MRYFLSKKDKRSLRRFNLDFKNNNLCKKLNSFLKKIFFFGS
jgi:hypothetical protein